MNASYINTTDFSFFSPAQAQLDTMIQHLELLDIQEHGFTEEYIRTAGDELLRLLLQGYLDKQAHEEKQKVAVTAADGVRRNHVRKNTSRTLTSLFGSVTVTRMGYSRRQTSSLFPLDAQLNLNTDQYTDGIRKRIVVLEYLWKAAYCLCEKGSEAAERWVCERALRVLQGRAAQVARGIRQSASKRKLKKRESMDKCADYLQKNQSRLRYDDALSLGCPIASGVIEGACRHLINDRLDITGTRWSLSGGEAVLKLRSIHSSGDWEEYWKYHRESSAQRNYGELIINEVAS